MRVVFCTRASFLEPALHYAREMSRLTEFHLLLELEPAGWSPMFASTPAIPRAGVLPAAPVLRECLPESIVQYWDRTASFHLIAYRNRRSFHPASLPVSHAAIRMIRKLKPDVLHLDDVSVRLALDFPELPRIDFLSVHDPVAHSGEQDWRTTFARRLTFGRVNRFILHSQALSTEFCQRYRIAPDLVHVSRLGAYTVYREWIERPVEEDPRTILFFGRLSPYKGLDRLYAAMPRVAERVPGVQLIVAGPPAYGFRPPPVPPLPNDGRIELIPRYIENREAAALMQRAAIVVCPYTDATQSGVVLTAFAFGKPVVATDVGGLPEYVRDGESGLVVPSTDPHALASAITTLLLDGALRRHLAAGVRRAVATELSWERRAADMLALYRSSTERR